MHQINLSKGYIYLTGNGGFGGWEFDGLYHSWLPYIISSYNLITKIIKCRGHDTF